MKKNIIATILISAFAFCAMAEGPKTIPVEKEFVSKSGAKINVKCALLPSWKVIPSFDKKEEKSKFTLVGEKNVNVIIRLDKADKNEKELPQKYADSIKSFCSNTMGKTDKNYAVKQETVALGGQKALKLSYDLSVGDIRFSHSQFLVKIDNDILIVLCTAQKEGFSKAENDFNKIIESVEFKTFK